MNIDKIRKLISSESLTDEEKKVIQEWISENEENAKALKELNQINNIQLDDYQNHDVDSAWNDLQENIYSGSKDDAPKVIPISSNPWAKIAAVLVVFIASLFVFQHFNKNIEIDNSPIEYVSELSSKAIDLKDGSEVLLDKKSTLKTISNREVTLKGQAYFNVAKAEGNEFIVNAVKGKIRVVGTEFNVISQDELIEVYVTEGVVDYINDTRTIRLKAGDYIKVINGDIIKLKNVDRNYMSWKNGELVYRDATLTEVVSSLQKHFDKKILISDQEAKSNCRLTSSFKDQNFKEVLTELKSLLGLKYTRDGDVIEIIDADC